MYVVTVVHVFYCVQDAFNSLEGVSCNFTEGAMYSFPRLSLPDGVSRLHL